MKRLKSVSFALALMVGVSAAVVAKVQAAPKPADPTYDWVGASNAPSHPGASLINKSSSDASTYYGCSSGSHVCANGTLDQGSGPATAQLKFP